MVRIGICDDDRQYQGVMESMLRELCGLHRLQAEIEVYTGGAELLEDLDTGGCLDLLFLDIEMKGMDGIQTALRIRKENRYMLIPPKRMLINNEGIIPWALPPTL